LLIAVDIAVLPPDAVSTRAIALSATLPAHESRGLLLGADCLPHITLTQQFVPIDALDSLMAHVDRVMNGREPMRLRVTGGGKGRNSVWMSIERTPALAGLHERLLDATEAFEAANGDASAFLGGDARDRDVRWVREFRRESSFDRFTPHILGRFCTCKRIIRAWALTRAR
jgi:hypothetical protein